MKKILLLALALTNTAFAQSLRMNNAQQFLNANAPRNYVLNSGAERNVLNITNASSIATQTTSVPLEGDASYSIDATATSQLVVFLGAALQSGLHGGNCEAKFTYSGDGSLYTAYATLNGVTVSTVGTLQNIASGSQPVSINFPCGVSTTDVASVVIASTGNGAVIKVDSVYIGAATNVGSVAQASFYGSGVYTGISNCTWPRTGVGSNSFAIPAADADCNTMAVTGRITAPGTKLPQIIATDAPSGRYVIYASFAFQKAGASDSANYALLSDGTTESGNLQWYPGTAQINAPTTVVGDFTYTSAGTRTWSIQTKQDVTSNTAGIDTGGTDRKLSFTVLYFPNSEQVLRIGAPGVGWTAFTPTGSWVSGTSTYTGQYQCSNGNLNVQYNVTQSGAPTATALLLNLPSGFTIDAAKLSNAGTGSLLGSTARYLDTAVQIYQGLPTYESTTSVRLKIVTVTGSNVISGADVTATAPFTFGSGDVVTAVFTVPVTADSLCASVSMPLVTNAVTTSSAGIEKQASGELNCDASSTFNRGGTGLTAGNRSTTSCGITIAAGVFSAQPWDCQVTVRSATVNAMSCSCSSATSCTVYGPNADYDAYLSIKGPN